MNTPELRALIDSASYVRDIPMPENNCPSYMAHWKAQLIVNLDMMIADMSIDINELRRLYQNCERNEDDFADMLEANIQNQEVIGNTDGLILWIEQQFNAVNLKVHDLVRSYSQFEGWNEMLFMDERSFVILFELNYLRTSTNIPYIDLTDE